MKNIFLAFLCFFIIKIAVAQTITTNLQRENLGENINSIHAEMLPIISADGKKLFLVRSGHPENVGTMGKEDVWFSELQPDGNWGKAQNIGSPINNSNNNTVLAVMPDGNTMFVMNTYNPDGTPKGAGLSVTYRNGNQWTVPVEIPTTNFYNNVDYSGYTFSPDQRAMIVSVSRNDTRGGSDLYISKKDENGVWGTPINLGSVINTMQNEVSPFMAADATTLYFSSNGKGGAGSFDVFVTRRLDDTWTNWSEPINLGAGVNTAGLDAYFSVPVTGEYAYLASSDNAIGKYDIFRIKLSQEMRPNPVVLIYGYLKNTKTNQPMAGEIIYEDLQTNQIVGVARANGIDGTYRISLPYGKNYGFLAKVDGFYAVNQNIDLSNDSVFKELQVNLELTPIEKGAVIRLNNLFFDTGKWDLKPSSYSELNRLVKIMNENKLMKIEISGHTDNVGSNESNQVLSENRAKAVVQYLVSQGIEATRLKAKGYGELSPIQTNDTPEGRTQNRRVEFKILEIN